MYRAIARVLVLSLAAAILLGSQPSEVGDRGVLIDVRVRAAVGGTFSDNDVDPRITIEIPAGALIADARLRVSAASHDAPLDANQTAASSPFRVSLQGSSPLTLQQPMKLILATDVAPAHPQLGEIAVLDHDAWTRLRASFFRASENTVVALTQRTRGVFRAVHRTLQTTSGDGVGRGRDLYFEETWGSEAFWGGRFGLHELLNVVDPATAVAVGAQIDIAKVPAPIVDVLIGDDFAAKQAALVDPATTRALLQADAVLGLRGLFDDPANPDLLTSVGLTCALCHVTVTPTEFQIEEPPAPPVLLPIGTPILGPPNAALDVGLILSLTPLVQEGDELPNLDQYQSWGPGMFDPRFLPDNPIDDGVNNPSQIPPHWNYVDLAEQNYAITWIGILQTRPHNESLASGPECGIDLPLGVNGAWGTENAVIQNFEFGNSLPQWVFDALESAEADEPGNTLERDDLLDIKAFMESLVSPAPGPFDEVQAEAGMELFFGRANCVACHQTAEGTGQEGRYFTNIVENRPQGLLGLGIRVPGLRGLATTAPYFHDGSAASLEEVVNRYLSDDIPQVPSDLTTQDVAALVEYLKSL